MSIIQEFFKYFQIILFYFLKHNAHAWRFFSVNCQPSTVNSRGFTLLLAALIASIVLALGSSIFLIAQKQVLLSSLSRDSQFAFYAADTGAECALLWRFRKDSFASAVPEAIDCAGQQANTTISSPVVDGLGNLISVTSTFDMNYDGHHYRVQVMRNMFPHPDPRTVITVFGENTDVAGVKSFQEMRVWDIDF